MRSSHSMVSICQKMIRFNPTVTMPMNRKDKKILRRREVSSFSPEAMETVVDELRKNETVTQIYRVTGKSHLHVHAVASGNGEMEYFITHVLDKIPGIVRLESHAILARVKDVKGLRL